MPVPSLSKAVPWSTLVRIIGRPTVMLTPALRPSGPCPGSSYIATTISKSPLTTLKKSVPAGSGPNACGQRQEQFSLLLLHVQTNHSHRHGGHAAYGDFRLRNACANERVIRQLNCRVHPFHITRESLQTIGTASRT